MPCAYALAAAATDSASLESVLPHWLGRPSVASTITGGEPAGGGSAANAATTASIACGVGVNPGSGPLRGRGGLLAISVLIAALLFLSRGAICSDGQVLPSVVNSVAPKYT